jgi:hypothetical protein
MTVHCWCCYLQVTNLQSKDLNVLRELIVFAHNLWAAPLTAVGTNAYMHTMLSRNSEKYHRWCLRQVVWSTCALFWSLTVLAVVICMLAVL